MNATIKTIAALAPLAIFGLAPAIASAAPIQANDSIGFVLADAGSAGGGDSHGHNSPNAYEQQQSQELQQSGSSPLHVHVLNH